jgi:hypothetical protein
MQKLQPRQIPRRRDQIPAGPLAESVMGGCYIETLDLILNATFE